MNIEHQSSYQEQVPVQTSSGEIGQDFIDYFLVLVKYKVFILAVTSAAAVIAVLYALTMTNIYTAKTMIVLGDDDNGIMGAMMAQMGGLASIAGDAIGGGKAKVDLYLTLAKSETLKDRIIDQFKLMDLYKAKYRADAYVKLDDKVKAAVGKKDGVITISVDDKDPKLAASMANAYVAELSKFAVEMTTTSAGRNKAFLQTRIAETRSELAKAEDAVKTFQAKNKAVSVTDQARATIEGVAQLRAQLASQEVQLAVLRRQFTESSQEVKAMKATIVNLRSQIAGLEGAGGRSSIPSVGSIPGLGQEYLRLMREFKIQEAILEMLVKQYEMASLSEAKDVSPLQIIQVAKVPEKKSKPSRAKFVILMTLVSFFLSVAYAFTKESFARMGAEERERWRSLLSQLLTFSKCSRN